MLGWYLEHSKYMECLIKQDSEKDIEKNICKIMANFFYTSVYRNIRNNKLALSSLKVSFSIIVEIAKAEKYMGKQYAEILKLET